MNRQTKVTGNNQRGTVLILVVAGMGMLIGMGALALDVTHLVVARNELKNAADAGALAAARFLYLDDGSAVNTGANQIGHDAAVANTSENAPVEVAADDVKRGHWSFGRGSLPRGFYPNDATDPVSLWNVSSEDLDANTNFINAVQVTVHRSDKPVAAYLARIFGITRFVMKATSVSYIGFAGTLAPAEVDEPLIICQQSLRISGDQYTCSIGRMINSGGNAATNNTGGYANFQENDCNGTNASELQGLICGTGNPDALTLGVPIGTNGGEITSRYMDLYDCWLSNADTTGDGEPDVVWHISLPVGQCPGNNVGTCTKLVGAVSVGIIFMTGQGTPKWDEVPTHMTLTDPETKAVITDWRNEDPDGQVRWQSFVETFNLKNTGPDGSLVPAPFAASSIYFVPDCAATVPKGKTGGENFGVLAKIPVLVQ